MITSAPTYTEIIPQQTILEPLEGPKPTDKYLDRFPDEIYNKSHESKLVKFLYTLLGPSGVGELRLQSFKNRLILEGYGVELFDLDGFYGNPFSFGRILNETYDEDIFGVLTRSQWDEIKTKDEKYRSRALDFVNGAKAGNTPLGIRLVARSGIGHEVEIIENYKYLFDIHSDDPLGLTHYGSTFSQEEFIVIPRQATPRNEIQTINFLGTPTTGSFNLVFNGEMTSTIPYDAEYYEVENALNALANIGANGVKVRVYEEGVYTIIFINQLSKQDVPKLEIVYSVDVPMEINTYEDGISDEDEVVFLTSRDKFHLESALDRIKPVNTLFTTNEASGTVKEVQWTDVTPSSEYDEVLRYVTGHPNVNWKLDNNHWIESEKEKQAKRVADDYQYHYSGFHNVQNITASTEHIGRFSPQQVKLFPYLSNTDDELRFTADRILADYAEPLTVQSIARPNFPSSRTSPSPSQNVAYINGIYPVDYLFYSGVHQIKYKEEQFWASTESLDATETILLDLGETVAVNYLQMEISRKPIDITIEFDFLDQPDRQEFIGVTPTWRSPSNSYPDEIIYESNLAPWKSTEFIFEDALGRIIYTRYIRISFERTGDLIFDKNTLAPLPWSIEVKNLRIGRNVSDF